MPTTFSAIAASTYFATSVLRPLLAGAAVAVQDASTPGKVASLPAKARRTHDLDCFAAPALYGALFALLGSGLQAFPLLQVSLCHDEVGRVAPLHLATLSSFMHCSRCWLV